MEELNQEETVVTDVHAVYPVEATPTLPPKAKRAPAKKKTEVRELKVLDTLDPRYMTPEEIKVYIKAVREQRDTFFSQLCHLEVNAKTAYETARNATQDLDALRVNASLKLNYVKGAIKNLNDSVQLILKEEK